jgi:hypothetical protein
MVVVNPTSFGDLLGNASKYFGDTTFQQSEDKNADRNTQRLVAGINAKSLLDQTRLQGENMLAREAATRQGNEDYLNLQTSLERKSALRAGLLGMALSGGSGGSSERFAGSEKFVSQLLGAGASLTPEQIIGSVNGTMNGLNGLRSLQAPWSEKTRSATSLGATYLTS